MLPGHTDNSSWVARSVCGNYIITSSKNETLIWDSRTFALEMQIEEKVVICFSKNRTINGFLHDGLYKKWSPKLLSSFSDEFKPKEKDGQDD